MTITLDTSLSIPYEREYEGNIVREIRNYFKSLDISAYVLVFSPKKEKQIPKDATLGFVGKVIGLQFKRLALNAARHPKYSKVKWEIDADQYITLRKFPEIFYPAYVAASGNDPERRPSR